MPKPTPYKIGDVLGDKEIIASEGKNIHGQYVWRVRCVNCGFEKSGRSSSSLKRLTPCRQCSTLGKAAWNWSGYEDMYGKWLYTTEQGALRRGLAWEITPADMWQQWLKQEGRCAYTGMQLQHGSPSERTASLDRIDSSIGYTGDNIQWVHKEINTFKHSFTEEKFLSMVKAIYEHKFSKG